MTATDQDWPATGEAAAVIDARCARCHDSPARLLPRTLSDERGVSFWQPQIGDPRLNTSRHLVFNLTHPEESLLLLAPLAANAGGWGLCRGATNQPSAGVFASTSDPDYQKLLALCTAGRDWLQVIARFDRPGFRPRGDWVREMQRYGVLPGSLTASDPIDVYATERRYWESLWHRPAPADATLRSDAGRH
jgi:hypothetical protein